MMGDEQELFGTDKLYGFQGDVAIERFEMVSHHAPGTDYYEEQKEEFDQEVEEFLNSHTWYDIEEYHLGQVAAFTRGVRILYDPEGDGQ